MDLFLYLLLLGSVLYLTYCPISWHAMAITTGSLERLNNLASNLTNNLESAVDTQRVLPQQMLVLFIEPIRILLPKCFGRMRRTLPLEHACFDSGSIDFKCASEKNKVRDKSARCNMSCTQAVESFAAVHSLQIQYPPSFLDPSTCVSPDALSAAGVWRLAWPTCFGRVLFQSSSTL